MFFFIDILYRCRRCCLQCHCCCWVVPYFLCVCVSHSFRRIESNVQHINSFRLSWVHNDYCWNDHGPEINSLVLLFRFFFGLAHSLSFCFFHWNVFSLIPQKEFTKTFRIPLSVVRQYAWQFECSDSESRICDKCSLLTFMHRIYFTLDIRVFVYSTRQSRWNKHICVEKENER